MSNAATNKQIYDIVLPLSEHVSAIRQSVEDIVRRLDRQNGHITDHEHKIAEMQSGLAILKDDIAENNDNEKTYGNRVWGIVLLVIGVALAVLQAMIITAISDIRAEQTRDEQFCDSGVRPNLAAPTRVSVLDFTIPASTPTPTLAPTLTPVQTMRFRGVDYTVRDVQYLSALCWVEARGMGDTLPRACASIVDTVFTRIVRHKFTDGTIAGTLTYGCNPGDMQCHFPAYVVNGCEFYTLCPYHTSVNLYRYESIVYDYLSHAIDPICPNYLYYGMQEFDKHDCIIENVENDQFIAFHN